MSTLSASFFISLDGVVEAPERWHFPYFNDEMAGAIERSIASSAAFLLGRRTYDEWAAYWPEQDEAQNPLAAAMNAMPKFVVSRSLTRADWQNSTVLEGDAVDAVADLKRRGDGEISISGSASLVRSLLDAGLVDELRLMVHPVVVGRGNRLFDEGSPQRPLELVRSQTFATGVLNLTYRSVASANPVYAKGTVMSTKTVAQKLQIKPGMTVWSSDDDRLDLLGPLPDSACVLDCLAGAEAAVVFAEDAASLREIAAEHADALREAQPLWVAYPKGNRTDVNRDTLWPLLAEHGMRPIGQVAIDERWSALRFRVLRPGETFEGGATS